ncbi:MAG: amidohydrolase, partial [Rhodothermales bacterium]
MMDRIRSLNETPFPDVIRLRRTIHQNPELAFEEVETARLVTETLTPLGLDVQTGVAKTGVMATLHGEQPGPTLLLRADMDALPIHEQNGFDFVSQNAGKM